MALRFEIRLKSDNCGYLYSEVIVYEDDKEAGIIVIDDAGLLKVERTGYELTCSQLTEIGKRIEDKIMDFMNDINVRGEDLANELKKNMENVDLSEFGNV